MSDGATIKRLPGNRITFKQRRLLMPWRVEWITQEWSDLLRCWITVSRVRVR